MLRLLFLTQKETAEVSDLLTQIYDQLATGVEDPIDFKIVSGSTIILGFFKGHTEGNWASPSNALHTVNVGKRLLILSILSSSAIVGDSGSRTARIYNITDGAVVVDPLYFANPYGAFTIPYVGDGEAATTFLTAAEGKTIELQLHNVTNTKRAMGAIVFCREVPA